MNKNAFSKPKKTVKEREYRITIDIGQTGSWSFRYFGTLSILRRIFFRLAGCKVTDLTPKETKSAYSDNYSPAKWGAFSGALLAVILLGVAACTTNSDGSVTLGKGANTITIPATDVKVAGQIVDSVIKAALNGTTSSLLTNGTINARQLAANSISALTASIQGSVGQIVPPAVLSSSPGVQSIGNTVSNTLTGVVVSQTLINNLNKQAGKLYPQTNP